MNYRHSWHAGNFADVFKHIILVALIEALQRKDTAWCYLDTHAGAGAYDLRSFTAQKTGEYCGGIAKILAALNPPPLVLKYLACVADPNEYPGSPAITRALLRPQDRMILCELHPDDCQILKTRFRHDPQVAVHFRDGWQSLKAFLPPPEKRGLVLIDPPYEDPDEFHLLPARLRETTARWPNGIYALWYPIKSILPTAALHRRLRQQITRPLLIAEIGNRPSPGVTGLTGCGMAIVNPPWGFDKTLAEVLPWLCDALGMRNGHSIIS